MFLNYNNLWKTLIDKGVKKGELCKMTGISTSTLSKMNRNEPVSLSIVLRICEKLDCTIQDVVTINKIAE
ncbi:DNA-binding transcriptional regulator, XRE family [Lachnospiraceae bacterium XBD2001]|nr:DNA-binding transcriptional regulator, XRE family [Lachnospiraceae bacterium XBD2001]